MNEDDYFIEEPLPPAAPKKPKKAEPEKKGITPISDDDAPAPAARGKKVAKAVNPRDGRAKKGAKDQAGKFVPGDAEPPKGFDPAEVCESLNLWWENDGGDSFVINPGGGELWSRWPMSSIKQLARMMPGRLIALKAREKEVLSEMDRVLLHARQGRCVEKVLPALAGYRAGVRELSDGRRVVVRMSPKLVQPEKGEWPTIKALIEDRLNLGEGKIDQSLYFHAWCKIGYESLMFGEPGSFKPGHAMVLAGPVGCGKSRLQVNIITPLFGGRKADPTAFLMGDDSFNADMMGAEHLMMEELLTSSWSAADRTNLSEAIKRMVANESKRMRLMRTDPLTVDPFWRFSLSINNDPDKLRAFPMLTGDFRDKVVMLLVAKRALPMPTRTVQEQKAFNDQVRKELPAYADWLLNEFELPESMLTYQGEDATRFGFASFQHPELADQLFDDTPAANLLRLIDDAEFEHRTGTPQKLWDLTHPLNTSGKKQRGGEWVNKPGVWEGSAETLENILCGHIEGWTSSVARAASRLLGKSGASTMLSRLREDRSDRVDKRDRAHERGWMIGASEAAQQ